MITFISTPDRRYVIKSPRLLLASRFRNYIRREVPLTRNGRYGAQPLSRTLVIVVRASIAWITPELRRHTAEADGNSSS